MNTLLSPEPDCFAESESNIFPFLNIQFRSLGFESLADNQRVVNTSSLNSQPPLPLRSSRFFLHLCSWFTVTHPAAHAGLLLSATANRTPNTLWPKVKYGLVSRREGGMSGDANSINTHTHIHTHTERERERKCEEVTLTCQKKWDSETLWSRSPVTCLHPQR